MNAELKELPYNQEAEQSVLGSILMDNSSIDRALDILSPDGRAFHSKAHQVLFSTFCDLYHRRKPIDIITVSDVVDEKDLKPVGGLGYIGVLTEITPSATNIEYYAGIVRDKSIRRHLIHQAKSLIDNAYSVNHTADELINLAQQGFIRSNHMVSQTYSEASDLLKDVEADFERRKGSPTGITTGLSVLDSVLGGFQDTDLILIAGRPSMGKTALSVQIALNIAFQGKRVGIFSIEVGRKQLVKNMCANQTKIDTTRFRDGKLEDTDYAKMTTFGNHIYNSSIRIDDSSRSSINICRQARKMKVDGGLDIIFIDHLQLMRENVRGISRNQELEIISGNLKALAIELEIPVVAVSQLSRAVETRGGDHRPMLSDLRESGALEQDADVIMFVFRDEYYTKHESKKPSIAEVMVEKHRNGATGSVDLRWTAEYIRFDNLEKRYE